MAEKGMGHHSSERCRPRCFPSSTRHFPQLGFRLQHRLDKLSSYLNIHLLFSRGEISWSFIFLLTLLWAYYDSSHRWGSQGLSSGLGHTLVFLPVILIRHQANLFCSIFWWSLPPSIPELVITIDGSDIFYMALCDPLGTSDESTIIFLVNWKPHISQFRLIKYKYRKVDWKQALTTSWDEK